jgi:hypothetical protein
VEVEEEKGEEMRLPDHLRVVVFACHFAADLPPNQNETAHRLKAVHIVKSIAQGHRRLGTGEWKRLIEKEESNEDGKKHQEGINLKKLFMEVLRMQIRSEVRSRWIGQTSLDWDRTRAWALRTLSRERLAYLALGVSSLSVKLLIVSSLHKAVERSNLVSALPF